MVWQRKPRDERLAMLAGSADPDGDRHPWDLVIIGGGITGAGVFREATRLGYRALLLERQDYAWGASSRSSKMIHGGLRYVASGHFALTKAAVRERERMLVELPGLVEKMPFLLPHYRGQFPGPRSFGLLLAFYDFLAASQQRRRLTSSEVGFYLPGLRQRGLKSASVFMDAVTDDARLVYRLIQEACCEGGEAFNYMAVDALQYGADGRVNGVRATDQLTDTGVTLPARVVVNATGAWADHFRGEITGERVIRPLRGSHLVLPFWRLPVGVVVTLRHPRDKRPVFLFPWEGVTIVGTTDLDHQDPLNQEPRITAEEVAYLLELTDTLFPASKITESDVISTWAGVRPVIDSGETQPSRASREHAVWDDKGMISVSGGKLTTFRPIANEVLAVAGSRLPASARPDKTDTTFRPCKSHNPCFLRLDAAVRKRLAGRYGALVDPFLRQTCESHLTCIGPTDTLLAELVWAVRQEDVAHLDDLMLRRTRLGLILPRGGEDQLPVIREACGPFLDWDARQWEEEIRRYRMIWHRAYGMPDQASRASEDDSRETAKDRLS